MPRRLDVVGLGGVSVDIVIDVAHLPPRGDKVMGRYVGHLPGGTIGNFICAAARLGRRAGLLSSVGGDEAGTRILEDLRAFGVESDRVAVRPGEASHFTVIMIEPSGERAIVVVPMYEEGQTIEEIAAACRESRALYTMGRVIADQPAIAHAARDAGCAVMIDVEPTMGADRATLERVLPLVDIASFNEAGLLAAAGERATEAAATRLLGLGPSLVAVTLGAQGALAARAGESARHPGFVVEPRDTTGAGDTFNAALLDALQRDEPLAGALRFACATAAISVTGLGPRGRLPTHAEVEHFLQANPDNEV